MIDKKAFQMRFQIIKRILLPVGGQMKTLNGKL